MSGPLRGGFFLTHTVYCVGGDVKHCTIQSNLLTSTNEPCVLNDFEYSDILLSYIVSREFI